VSCRHGYPSTATCLFCLREARDAAIREASAYARRCGELEAQLCGKIEDGPDRKAMLLVLAELRRAKALHPVFAYSADEAMTALTAENGELATAIVRGDITGEHGIIREASQVAAVAIRIVQTHLAAEG
jgi:hypothetical protein